MIKMRTIMMMVKERRIVMIRKSRLMMETIWRLRKKNKKMIQRMIPLVLFT